MPWVEHYRFTKPFPRRLLYANGALELEIAHVPAEGFSPWRFRARKLHAAQTVVDLCSADTRHELDRCLHSDGFAVPQKFDSPPHKIMRRLVHEGFAHTVRIKINSKTGARG